MYNVFFVLCCYIDFMTTSTAEYPVVEVVLDVSEFADFDGVMFASGIISWCMLSEWHNSGICFIHLQGL